MGAIVLHCVGINLAKCSNFSSSSRLHSVFLMLGSSHSNQRALHCFGDFLCRSEAIRAHWFFPYFITAALRISSWNQIRSCCKARQDGKEHFPRMTSEAKLGRHEQKNLAQVHVSRQLEEGGGGSKGPHQVHGGHYLPRQKLHMGFTPLLLNHQLHKVLPSLRVICSIGVGWQEKGVHVICFRNEKLSCRFGTTSGSQIIRSTVEVMCSVDSN